MDYIKYIDSFGIRFHFYTNNQPTHQNIFGGIMTTIYILVCIGIFIIFSYEDIQRLKPISSISEINDVKPRTINIKNEKIWLPFRIVTDKNKYIDHRGILYIYPYYIEGKKKDKEGMELKYHLLNYKLCNETSMANKPNNYKIDIPLNELFCIEQDDILFGGNWNGNFINYIEINLYLCEDKIYFNSSDSRCANVINLFNRVNSSLSFDFYYPIVQFQPTNYETPIEIIYKNYFYRLSAYSQKLEKIYIQEHILSDDRNIIKSNHKNSSCWGMNSIYGDEYFLSNENSPIIKNKSGEIYTMEIFMDYGLVYYTRTYNKIFSILSNVFPLFKLALYFIKSFTQHIKMSFTKRKLAGLIFENKNLSNLSLLKLMNINENKNNPIKKLKIATTINVSHNDLLNDINNNNNINDSINNDKLEIINNKKNSFQINNDNINNISNISLNNEKIINKLNKKDISLINSRRKSILISENLKRKDSSSDININHLKSKNNSLFSYYYFFLDFFFDKLINPQKFCCLSKTYFTVYNFMCQIYDISTHIILFKQFNIVNNILKKIYEEKGFCLVHPFKKININDMDIIEKLNKDLKNKKCIIFSKNLL